MTVFYRALTALVSFTLLLLNPTAFSQDLFTKITDPENPIVSFTPTGGYSGATWVDYDNDGDLDLFANSEFLFRNDGDGNFTAISGAEHGIESGHLSSDYHDGNTWGDFDNDGWTDVYMANRTSALFRNNGDGSFSKVDGVQSTGVNAWAAAFGDYDEDGYLDIVAVHPCGFIGTCHENWLFKSDGNGGFTSISNDVTTGNDAYTIGSWSDFDLDGDLDLFIGSGEISNLDPDNIYFNQLTETGTPDLIKSDCPVLCTDARDGQNWNWIDYDNDGDMDGFVTNYGKSNDFYRNDNGSFHKLTDDDTDSDLTSLYFGRWLTNVWEDFNNDGYIDVYLGNDGGNDLMYLNDGDGTFTKTTQAFTLAAGTRGVTAGDYDKDGAVDLFVSSATATGKGLYHNNGNDNNWASFQLQGDQSNRSAIGAIVRAKAQINGIPVWQIREISAQNSFAGSNSLWAHFGLGDASMIDSLHITWPQGLEEAYVAVETGKFCTIVEGGGMECASTTPTGDFFKENEEFKVFPNPNGIGVVTLMCRGLNGPEINVRILSTDGKTIWENSFANIIDNQINVDTRNIPAGFYYIKLETGNKILTKSIILAE